MFVFLSLTKCLSYPYTQSLFSDIVGFTEIASRLSAIKVSDMLDRLYNAFDHLSRKHDIFKVETIGKIPIIRIWHLIRLEDFTSQLRLNFTDG